MKRQIRKGVFESNSSSIHAISMCMESDYDRWKNGELVYDKWEERLVEKTLAMNTGKYCEYLTYEQFNDWCIEYETFEDSFTTPSGDKIISFGYYGMDN